MSECERVCVFVFYKSHERQTFRLFGGETVTMMMMMAAVEAMEVPLMISIMGGVQLVERAIVQKRKKMKGIEKHKKQAQIIKMMK